MGSEVWVVIECDGVRLGRVRAWYPHDAENPEGVSGHFGRMALEDVLSDYPRNPADPTMEFPAWVNTATQLVSKAMRDSTTRDEKFEAQVMHRLLRHQGSYFFERAKERYSRNTTGAYQMMNRNEKGEQIP